MLRQFVRSLLLEAMAPIDSRIFSTKIWNKIFTQNIWIDQWGWQWLIKDPRGNRNYPSGRSDLDVHFVLEAFHPEEDPIATSKEEKESGSLLPGGSHATFGNIKREFMKQGVGLGKWQDELVDILRKDFSDFASKRGWNLLHIYIEPVMGFRPSFAIRLQLDANPHKSSPTYTGLGKEMEDYMFLHLTKTRNVPGIQKTGFVQSRVTSDDRRFGTTGRTFFLRVTKQEYTEKLDAILEWMKATNEQFAGIKENTGNSVIVVDGGLVEDQARFYIDTEFGRHGSGWVNTEGAFNGYAVYTTHQLHPMSIVQVFDL